MDNLIFIIACLLLAIFAMSYGGVGKVRLLSVSENPKPKYDNWNRGLYIIYLLIWFVFSYYWIYDSIFTSVDISAAILEKPSDDFPDFIGNFIFSFMAPALVLAGQIVFLILLLLGFTAFSFILIIVLPESRFQSEILAMHKVHFTMVFVYLLGGIVLFLI